MNELEEIFRGYSFQLAVSDDGGPRTNFGN